MNPLFSVIVPIFNKEKYINECIDSILNQSFNNFELILVDDGSSDNCPSICDSYKKKDSRVVAIHKENGGLVSARKAGTKIAKGEYIVCVDADDYIENNYLSGIAKEIENKHAEIICTGHTRLDESKKQKISINYRSGYYTKEDIINEIYPSLVQDKKMNHFPVNIWSKAYKKVLYSKIQLNVDESVKIGEDGVVSIPYIYMANSMSIIEEYGYVYRINNLSMTNSIAVLDPLYPKKAYIEYIKYIDKESYDFKEQLDRFVVHQVFTMVITQFNKKQDYKTSKNEIIEALDIGLYKETINSAYFSNFEGHVIKYILNNKHILFIYLLSLLKKYGLYN